VACHYLDLLGLTAFPGSDEPSLAGVTPVKALFYSNPVNYQLLTQAETAIFARWFVRKMRSK
jgi:hypothetical protein